MFDQNERLYNAIDYWIDKNNLWNMWLIRWLLISDQERRTHPSIHPSIRAIGVGNRSSLPTEIIIVDLWLLLLLVVLWCIGVEWKMDTESSNSINGTKTANCRPTPAMWLRNTSEGKISTRLWSWMNEWMVVVTTFIYHGKDTTLCIMIGCAASWSNCILDWSVVRAFWWCFIYHQLIIVS